MRSPLEIFEDNIRPADFLLQVYHLLDTNDHLQTEGELIESLRTILQANPKEDLLMINNKAFLGLVRENARLHPTTLKRVTLSHLLRQSIIVACTAMETFLPALLRSNLPIVIRARGRDFIPITDGEIVGYFKDLNFTLDETLRLVGETARTNSDAYASEFISTKILGLIKFQYITGQKGVNLVGKLLGLDNPWDRISEHLTREKKQIKENLETTIDRRNDIAHRADSSKDDLEGEPQEISYSWTKQSIDTVQHVCIALDELVAVRIKELEAAIPAS
jgi:hypothetical protein